MDIQMLVFIVISTAQCYNLELAEFLVLYFESLSKTTKTRVVRSLVVVALSIIIAVI